MLLGGELGRTLQEHCRIKSQLYPSVCARERENGIDVCERQRGDYFVFIHVVCDQTVEFTSELSFLLL